MQITSFHQPSTEVTVNPDRDLTWSLSVAGISLHGDWRMNWRIILKITDHGSFDASASGASISLSVTLGKSAAGEPTIRTTGCTCHIDRLRIRLHGGASWLYNFFMRFVEGEVRDRVEGLICENAQNAVNKDWARELAALSMEVPLDPDRQWLLDYRMVWPPAFKSGYLELFPKGEFFNAGHSTKAPFQPLPLPSPPIADHMVTFWVSSYFLNSASHVIQKHGILRHTLTKKDLPEKSRDLLNTTCSVLSGCIGSYVPAVGKKFPNASVELDMVSSSAPIAGIDPQKVIVSFAGVAVFRARLSDGSLAHLFRTNVTAKVTVTPRLDGTVLKASVSSMENALTVIDSSVGPIAIEMLQLIFEHSENTFIIPKLNEAGEKGFPLPNTMNVKFTNAGIQLENDCVRVFTDVAYSPSTLYFGL